MKTFEERYTEWIDDRLEGPALAAFEAELADRAAAGDAAADKAAAAGLRALLREHLSAPALTNADFFNHQLRQRMEAESAQRVRETESAPAHLLSWMRWSWRLAAVSAAGVIAVAAVCLTLVLARYAQTSRVAVHPPVPAQAVSPAPNPEEEPASVAGAKPMPEHPTTSDDMQMARNDSVSGFEAHVTDDSTSATALNYKVPNKEQNVKVLWLNGLDYVPEMPEPPQDSTAAPGASPEGEMP